ncbi:MAG TPA: ATP-binding protein [Thermoanaerobaculia bacterium]|jgi:PAS domain S-box-containing protein|nr:ATP-binding protein [Thermoanaerobaculia bacterium]
MIPRAVRLAVWGMGAMLVALSIAAAVAARVPVSLALGAGALITVLSAAWMTHRARRVAEEALRRSEEQFRRAIVDAPIPILMHAEDGEVLALSHAWTRLSGYSREHIPTVREWLDLAYGPSAGQVEERIRSAFEGNASSEGGTEAELVIRTRDGESRIWTFTAGEPGRLPDGRLFLVTMATDVTERRQADEALHDSQERLRMAVEGTGLGTWDFNPVTGRLTWSERCKEIHGLPPDAEIDYSEYLVRIHPEDWDRVHQAMQEAMDPASQGAYEVEYRAVPSAGEVRWITSRGCVFFRGEGEDRHATRFIGTVMDVTGRKQAEEELRQAKEDAEAANRAKDQFLATLSHELRTPLTPVLALITGLEGDRRMRDVADRLAMIRRNVELEARLIDDLLDLTRIARGKLELQRAVCDVRALVEHAIQICCAESCDAGRLRVVTELEAMEHRVWGDGSRLMQIFWNLLRNSVKFTPEGGTIVVRTWNDEDEHASALVVEITDTGIGIEPGSIPHIFEAFSQGAPARGGLGLGLSISKAVADLHGGRITALSPGYGLGATFRVELPTGGWPVQAEPSVGSSMRQAPEPPSRRPLRLLLVEDHPDTAEAMAELLRALGHEVRVAMCVAAGLEAAAAEMGSGAGIDLVISDLGLPDGTGMDLMRQLVSRYGLRGIALSGYGTEDDVRRSLEAGFSRHLTKPVNFKALEAVIHETAGARPA